MERVRVRPLYLSVTDYRVLMIDFFIVSRQIDSLKNMTEYSNFSKTDFNVGISLNDRLRILVDTSMMHPARLPREQWCNTHNNNTRRPLSHYISFTSNINKLDIQHCIANDHLQRRLPTSQSSCLSTTIAFLP